MAESGDHEIVADLAEFLGKLALFGGGWALVTWLIGSETGWSLAVGAIVFGALFGAHGVWLSHRIRRKFGSIAAKNEYDQSRRKDELQNVDANTEAGISWDRWKLSRLAVLNGLAFGGGAVLAVVLGQYWVGLGLGIVAGLATAAVLYEWRRLSRFEDLYRRHLLAN